jgi:hypothetical protein
MFKLFTIFQTKAKKKAFSMKLSRIIICEMIFSGGGFQQLGSVVCGQYQQQNRE